MNGTEGFTALIMILGSVEGGEMLEKSQPVSSPDNPP